MATRTYSATSGVVDLGIAYGVAWNKDKILRDLSYTEAKVREDFPSFVMYWETMGWPVAELLDLYLFECAWNDALISGDRYFTSGVYVRPNGVSQSRVWIVAPCGKYRVRYGCMTALGRYSGQNPQLSADSQGVMPGGTGIEIDHVGWSARNPNRIGIWGTPWGKDYSQIGGLAYQEGIIVENFRLMGAKSKKTGTYFCTGLALNEPGENSRMTNIMMEDFPASGAGATIFNGTPFVIDTCSMFNNDGPGIDLWGSNGLCNVRIETPSGDNNLALIRIRPKDSQSVGGGTITITNLKSESRGAESGGRAQIPVMIEGNMGDLNLTVNGMTADFIDCTCPYLIGGNWTGTQYEVNANGIDLRSNTQALFAQGAKLLTGGKQYSGNSFIVNDEGLQYKSRPNMVLSGSGYTGTWQTGAWGPCVNGTQTRTVTCVGGTCDPATKPAESQACGVTPTMTARAFAFGVEGGIERLPKYIVDGDPKTFWISGKSMTADGAQWVDVDYGIIASRSSVSFDITNGYVNSYPRTFDVQVSNDGNSFTTVKSGVAGAYPKCSATFTAQSCRFIRVVCKTANSNWWTIQEWK